MDLEYFEDEGRNEFFEDEFFEDDSLFTTFSIGELFEVEALERDTIGEGSECQSVRTPWGEWDGDCAQGIVAKHILLPFFAAIVSLVIYLNRLGAIEGYRESKASTFYWMGWKESELEGNL